MYHDVPYHITTHHIIPYYITLCYLSVEARPKSKCEKERDAVTNGPLLVGAFTPQCESDGSYSAVQCHGSTGYCWCVDGEGNKLIETEIRFDRPNCTKGEMCTIMYHPIRQHTIPYYITLCYLSDEARPKSKCEKERDAVTNGQLLLGAFTPQCEDDGSYSAVQCHGSTGYCWCVDGEGNKLVETEIRFDRPNCTKGEMCTIMYHPIPQHTIPYYITLCYLSDEARPKSKCEKERDAVTNGPLLVGAFTPQCESDGSYSAVQCHGSTGYCWCVDGEGNKLVETEIRFDRPNCTKGEMCTMMYHTIPQHTIPYYITLYHTMLSFR